MCIDILLKTRGYHQCRVVNASNSVLMSEKLWEMSYAEIDVLHSYIL